MVSDVKRAKLTHYFHTMDATGDGLIKEQDILAGADRVISVLEIDPASEPAQQLKAGYLRNWESIAEADGDGDQAVTMDEWIEYYDRLAMDQAQFDSTMVERGRVIMQLFDRDRDNRISLEDWQLFWRTIGTAEADFETAFQKLDRNGNGYLTFDEIIAAGQEFFTSDDPEARGNWLYGDYTKYL
jgi:Ca2+-binding EF-hand superfamily protein